MRPDEVLETVADVGKAKRIFGWEPRVPLEEGLGRIIKARLTPTAGFHDSGIS